MNSPVVWGSYDPVNQATVFGIGYVCVSVPDAETRNESFQRFSELYHKESRWEDDVVDNQDDVQVIFRTGRALNDSPEVVTAFSQLCQDLYDAE